MKKTISIGATVCLLAMTLTSCITDYAGYCDMYVANESGHSVEFEVYNDYGKDPTTVSIPAGTKVKVRSYDEMGYASVAPQRIFRDTVVFRFDDGMNLTCTGTPNGYGDVITPFSPENNNVLDLTSWDITKTKKSKHCPLKIGVYTLTESEYNTAERQTATLP